jgi:hypothetical protein
LYISESEHPQQAVQFGGRKAEGNLTKFFKGHDTVILRLGRGGIKDANFMLNRKIESR